MPSRRLTGALLLALAYPALAASSAAQFSHEPPPDLQAVRPESHSAGLQSELTERLAALEDARARQVETESRLREALESLDALLTAPHPEEGAVVRARSEIDRLSDAVELAAAETEAFQERYERAMERRRIAAEDARLARAVDTAAQDPTSGNVVAKRTRAETAQQQAALAQRRTESLERERSTLMELRRQLQGEIDEIDAEVATVADEEQQSELRGARDLLLHRFRAVEADLETLREEILVAKTTQRIKEEAAEVEAEELRRWYRELLFVLAVVLAVMVVGWIARRLASRLIEDGRRRYSATKNISTLTTILVIVFLLAHFARELAGAMTGIGIAVAGLAIALQETLSSFLAWFFIRGPRGYRPGDWVTIGGTSGEVVDIGWLQTYLHLAVSPPAGSTAVGAVTGGLAVLPNHLVIHSPFVNYTRVVPYVFAHLEYTVTFESDWRDAERLILSALAKDDEISETAKLARRALDEAAGDFRLRKQSTEPVLRTAAAGYGVTLKVRFLVHPRRRAHLEDKLNRRIMTAVESTPDIHFAYPTFRAITTPTATTGLTEEP